MVLGHILQNDRIGTNQRVVAHTNGAQELCAGAKLHVTTNDWRAARLMRTQGDLLKNKAVWPHLCIRMNHDPIGVGEDEPTSNPAIQGYVCTSHGTPEAVSEGGPTPQDGAERSCPPEPLVVPNTF